LYVGLFFCFSYLCGVWVWVWVWRVYCVVWGLGLLYLDGFGVVVWWVLGFVCCLRVV